MFAVLFNVHNKISITAPPEITVEKSWVHASEGYDIELACIIHGDVTSDVSRNVYNVELCIVIN